MFRERAIFHTASVAILLTYKHNNNLLDGLSIKIANTLERKAGIPDTVKKLKCPISLLKITCSI